MTSSVQVLAPSRSPIRVVAKLALGIALITGIAFALYLAGRFAIRRWDLILLSIYLLGAALTMIAGAIGYHQQTSKAVAENATELVAIFFKTNRAHLPALERWRTNADLLINFFCVGLTWPAALGTIIRRRIRAKGDLSGIQLAAMEQLGADPFTVHPTAMLFSVALVGAILARAEGARANGMIYLGAAIAYVSLLCVRLTIAPTPVSVRLRQSSGSPYRKALWLGLATTATLTLAYAAILGHGVISVDNLVEAARGLYSQWDSAKALFQGKSVAGLSLMMGLSGALLASAVLQGLVNIREFRRTNDDIVAVAQAKLITGRPADALVALDRVAPHTVHSLTVRSIALAASGQIPAALEAWQRKSALEAVAGPTNAAAPVTKSDGDVLVDVLGACVTLGVAERIAEMLISQSIKLGVSESRLVLAVYAATGTQKVPPGELLAAIENTGQAANYPLSMAVLKLTSGDHAGAMALVQQVQPAGGIVDMIASMTRLQATIMGPTSREQDEAAFAAWCAAEIDSLARMVDAPLPGDDLFLVIATIGSLGVIGEALNSTYGERIRLLGYAAARQAQKLAPTDASARVALHFARQVGLVPPTL